MKHLFAPLPLSLVSAAVVVLAANAQETAKPVAPEATQAAEKSGPQNQPPVEVTLKDNEVIQGGIIRWKVDGATECGRDGRRWPVVDGVAYFPIDMSQTPEKTTLSVTANGKKLSKTVTIVKKDYGQEAIELPVAGGHDHAHEGKKEEGGGLDLTRFVEPTGKEMVKHRNDQAEIRRIVKGSGGPARFSLPLAQPVDSLPAADPNFAVRRYFNKEEAGRHTGQDYPVPTGTPIKAMADGKVVLTGDHFFAGKSVYIDHGAGLVTMYFHLDEIVAQPGQEVKKGDVVAKSGQTGRGTGPHLHIGARWNNERIDPKLLLESPDQLPSVKE